jgi:hypothetical protein
MVGVVDLAEVTCCVSASEAAADVEAMLKTSLTVDLLNHLHYNWKIH